MPEELVFISNTIGTWSVRDIIAHLAAWNWEAIEEVGRVLKNAATWPDRYEDKAGEDAFNWKAVEKCKAMLWPEVLKDWDDSFWVQIKKMEQIQDKEWAYQCRGHSWKDGSPVTVFSLFSNEYEGEGHEGGHAKQIRKYLDGR